MSRTVLVVAVAVLLAVVLMQTIVLWQSPAPSPEAAAERADREQVAEGLARFGPVDDLSFDSETGLYRATISGQIVYATADGRYVLAGELYDLETRKSVTERARTGMRKDALAELDPDSAIVYNPAGDTRAAVWVFTDTSCPYCRDFHKQIDRYTAAGIEVRYLAYPRSGPDTEDWDLMRSVWCASDRRAALTAAKSDQPVDAEGRCDTQAVRRHYEAGKAAGLRGTPMILTADGRALGGYLSPEELVSRLGLDD